jgi:hypothetical protein
MLGICIPAAWVMLALLLRQALVGRRLSVLFSAVGIAFWMAVAAAVLGSLHLLTRTPLLIWWGATDLLLLIAHEMAVPSMRAWLISLRGEKWGINQYTTAGLMALAAALLLASGILAAVNSSQPAPLDGNLIQRQFAILSGSHFWSILVSCQAVFLTMIAASLLVAIANGAPAAQALAAVLVILCPPVFRSPAMGNDSILLMLALSIMGIITMQTVGSRRFTLARGVWTAITILLAILTYPAQTSIVLPAVAAYLLLDALLPLLGLFARRHLAESHFWDLLIMPYVVLILAFTATYWTANPNPYLPAALCLLAAPAAILMMTRNMRIPAALVMVGLMVNLAIHL